MRAGAMKPRTAVRLNPWFIAVQGGLGQTRPWADIGGRVRCWSARRQPWEAPWIPTILVGAPVKPGRYDQALAEPRSAAHQGRIVKRTGDGLLVKFASAVEAVRCALAIQSGMTDRNRAVPKAAASSFKSASTWPTSSSRRGHLRRLRQHCGAPGEHRGTGRDLRLARRTRFSPRQAGGRAGRSGRKTGQEHPQTGAGLPP